MSKSNIACQHLNDVSFARGMSRGIVMSGGMHSPMADAPQIGLWGNAIALRKLKVYNMRSAVFPQCKVAPQIGLVQGVGGSRGTAASQPARLSRHHRLQGMT